MFSTTLPKEVVLASLKACCDVYPHTDDFLINRDIEGYTILAIEGTNEMTDWVTNIKFLLKSDDCHRGFKSNAHRTLSQLVLNYEALCKERKLIFAGHSLGGATATIVADLMYPYDDNIAIVTAGSPRPGGRRLRKRLKDVEHLRFVHGDDVVPKTPPFMTGYVHTHEEIYLEDENDRLADGVEDHNVNYYYKAVKKLYEDT